MDTVTEITGVVVAICILVGFLADFFSSRLPSWTNFFVRNWPYLFVRKSCKICWLFSQFLFDVHDDIDQRGRLDVGDPHRLKHDRERILHAVWHSVVYLPVVVVAAVAYVLDADEQDIYFFVMVASATVSLEICIGIILDKSRGLQDLSRQTRRALRQYEVDSVASDDAKRVGNSLHGWIDYLRLRHSAAREGVAKAALVTAVSVVLFGSIVGIEATRMRDHSAETRQSNIANWLMQHTAVIDDTQIDPTSDPTGYYQDLAEQLIEDTEKPHGDGTQLFAAILSTIMFFLATVKLWIQTRSCLETTDAMDRFGTGEEAKRAFLIDPIFHLVEEDEIPIAPEDLATIVAEGTDATEQDNEGNENTEQ